MSDLDIRTDGNLRNFYGSLSNPLTGAGTLRDKGMGFEVSPTYRIQLQEGVWLYRDNWLLQRAIDLLPKEATREWFEWKLGDTQLKVWADLDGYLRRLEARMNFREAVRSERHYGGCGMLVGVDDGQGQDQPINLERIRSVTFLQPLDRHRIYPEQTVLNSNPLKPEHFLISDSRLLQPNGEPLGIRVHRSRVLIFPGIGDWNVRQQNGDGWGDSILQAIYNSFVRFFGSLGAVGSTIQDFSVFMLSIAGLREILMAPNGEEKLRALVELNDRARSVHKLVVTDAQREKISELSRSLGGVEPILAFMKEELTAAVGVGGTIPATILWGQSPAGENATGESDRFAFAQSAHQLQEEKIRTPLEWLTELIFRAKDGPTGGRIPDDWMLEPIALYQRSQKEVLEERKMQAEIDEKYLTLQVLTVDEVRQARFGQAEYSHETVLLEELEAEGTESVNADVAERFDDATPVKRIIDWNGFKIGLQYLPFQLRHKKVLPVAYGHIQKTKGDDSMALDCYVNPGLQPEDPIFAIQQLVNGELDEEKIMLGFASAQDAQATFEQVMAPEMFGGIRELSLEDLRQYQTTETTKADEIRQDYIRKQGSYWIVYSEAGSQLGKHRTKKAAQKQLQAIEINKHGDAEPLVIEGRVLTEAEFEQMSEIVQQDIAAAVADWKRSAPEKWSELLEAEAYADPDSD
jgi:phage-related protein (TIGR01555 family)